jgi:transcriptional regulator GlxA family with amidase domain
VTQDIYFVVTPQFLLLDFAGPAEAFAFAARLGARFRAHYVGFRPSLGGALGVSLGPLEPLPEVLPERAVVFLSGVLSPLQSYRCPEARATVAWLRRALTSPTHRLAAVCSGALLAAQARLLDGKRCTTHHTLLDALRSLAPTARVVDDCVFVVDGRIMTSAGVSAGVDLALHVIEDMFGPSVAQGVARELVVWLRRTGTEPQMSPWLEFRNHVHPVVHRVEDVISRAPAREYSLEELAALAHTSVRNLTRLFREHTGITVARYQQRLRVALARQLLADPRNSMERVAELAGFQSARSLRRVFGKLEGEAPSRYRGKAHAASLPRGREG